MEQFNSMLISLAANFQDQPVAFIILVTVTMFVFSMGLSFVFMGATNPIRRRLDNYFDGEDENREMDGRILVTIKTMVGSVSHWVMPKADVELNAMTKQLGYAG